MRFIARSIALLLALSGTTFLALGAAAGPAQAKDMNCDDFSSQSSAQSYFNNNGGGPNNNVDGLDSDGDGIACESNPCPCNYSTGGGGGGTPGGGGGQTQPKKKHALTAKVNRVGPARKLVLNGKVTTFKGGSVQVLRKAAGQGFRAYKKTKANARTGVFSHPLAYVGNSKTCFKVVAPETKHYLKTEKFLGCFVRP
jgi:excalibur calcium-binding domain-containing protein